MACVWLVWNESIRCYEGERCTVPGKNFCAQICTDWQTVWSKEDHEHAIKTLEQHFKVIFSKYGVEKYDAFDDVGGKLSFALALLDKDNSGIMLNAVHSRDNCFLYLKEIVKGESYVMLSQEEVEALRKAVNFELGEMSEDEKNLEK